MSEQEECCPDRMSGLRFGLAESLMSKLVICSCDVIVLYDVFFFFFPSENIKKSGSVCLIRKLQVFRLFWRGNITACVTTKLM